MKKILVLLAHPNLKKSKANRLISDTLKSISNIYVHDLYENYPRFFIDVKHEQNLLAEHDIVVMQHPFYWYNMPPLLKSWHDDVLELGYAYGPGGQALAGKTLVVSITAGGPEEAYTPEGYNHYHVADFLNCYKQTARLCGMTWHNHFVLFNSTRSNETQIQNYAQNLCKTLMDLSNAP